MDDSELVLCPLMIFIIDKKYKDNPKLLKSDIDTYYANVNVKEV